MAAVAALDYAGGASAVEEKNGLLAGRKRVVKTLLQVLAEHTTVALSKLVAHVDDADIRQVRGGARPFDTRWQDEATDGPTLGGVRGAKIGCRAAEHDDCAGDAGHLVGHVSRVVAGCAIHLLVRPLVLFVEDDETEVSLRGEEGRSRADDDPTLAPMDGPPFLPVTHGRETTLEQGDLPREPRFETSDGLGSQG